VERELRLAGFWESIPARNKLKADIQKTLLQPDYKTSLTGFPQMGRTLRSPATRSVSDKKDDAAMMPTLLKRQ
jgi:hypothetical protein